MLRNTLLLLTFIIISIVPLFSQSWQKIGNSLLGIETQEQFGFSVSVNSNGTIVAIGAPFSEGFGTDAGQVRIFKLDSLSLTWMQLGNSIKGQASDDNCGFSVSINAQGDIVAIGEPFNDESGQNAGQVRIFKYNNSSNTWIQLGNDINGPSGGNQFGYSVSINAQGNIVAISAPFNDANGLDAGLVKVYQYDSTSATWGQLGNDILGSATGNQFGFSLSLNADGYIIAIGAPYNDDVAQNAGQVKIFQFNHASNTWEQLGNTLEWGAIYDALGWDVSISADGYTVAMSAPFFDSAGYTDVGQVRVYKYQSSSNSWQQLGNSIINNLSYEQFGRAISLNDYGNFLAIGIPYNDSNANDAGKVKIFKYDDFYSSWIQIDNDIHGAGANNIAGWDVSLNSDGSIVAIGLPQYSVSSSEGTVEIYTIRTVINTQPLDNNVCKNSEVKFGIKAENVINYQWQVSTDGGNNFFDIINNGIYFGANSDTLIILSVSEDMDGFLYRCILSDTFNIIISDTAALTIFYDDTQPIINCLDTTINLPPGQYYLVIDSNEFDPIVFDDCSYTLTNDFNNASSLSGVSFYAGTYNINWTVIDAYGNTNSCQSVIRINATSDLQNLFSQKIIIYPNPTTGFIYVKNDMEDIKNIKIFDQTGIKLQDIDKITKNLTIDLSYYAKGIYFIQVITDKNIYTKKIVKQ